MFRLFKAPEARTATIIAGSHDIEFTVEPGMTLLNAALASGIDWPHKCKVGSCGTCRCQVVSGAIKPYMDFSYVLTPEQLNNGYALACQSELKSDITVRVKLRNKERQNEQS